MRTLDRFYHKDFSKDKETLMSIPIGEISSENQTKLVDLLNSYETETIWGVGEKFDITKATVYYTGINHNYFPTKSRFSHVFIIEFNDPTIEPFGSFFLQFNTDN